MGRAYADGKALEKLVAVALKECIVERRFPRSPTQPGHDARKNTTINASVMIPVELFQDLAVQLGVPDFVANSTVLVQTIGNMKYILHIFLGSTSLLSIVCTIFVGFKCWKLYRA